MLDSGRLDACIQWSVGCVNVSSDEGHAVLAILMNKGLDDMSVEVHCSDLLCRNETPRIKVLQKGCDGGYIDYRC